MRKWILGFFVVIIVSASALWFSTNKNVRALLLTLPTDANVLFWNQEQRDAAFRVMDGIPFIIKSRTIKRGNEVHPLPLGKPLALPIDIDAYMQHMRVAGLVVLQDGKIRLERYGLGFDASGRWTSFSVAKSLTSTLVGAAIKDGYIKSLDDKVSAYIADLKGSVYDDVTIRQLLTMTSGVKWNEDYSDPHSDVALFNKHMPDPGVDATVSYMRKLPRETPAGTKWVYKTGETNLIGVLVSSATKKTLSEYLSEKIWAPYGMEQDATWLLNSTGHEIAGCCLQAAIRDFARFGQFIVDGGVINGKTILPDDWLANAIRDQVGGTGHPDKRGYGYQWWTYSDGAVAARGIFGQGIFIDTKRKLVIVSNGNWPHAREPDDQDLKREDFYRAVQAAVDRDSGN